MITLKAKTRNCPNRVMDGTELKRLRTEARLTQIELAEKMKPWGWYREKVVILESSESFELNPNEMQSLLDSLGATSI